MVGKDEVRLEMNKGGFSWKRLLGITRVKSQVSRALGIPLTKSGRERKVGKILTGGGLTLSAALLATSGSSVEEVRDPKAVAAMNETTEDVCGEIPESGEPPRVDPGGWNRAKWGMTDLEVLGAFQGDARRLANPEAFRFGVGLLRIENHNVGTMKANVMFIFSRERKLVAVQITSPFNVDSAGGAATATLQQQFDYLRNGLIEKYGPESNSDQPYLYRRAWTLPTTLVQLEHLRTERSANLLLTYKLIVPASLQDSV